MRDEEAIDRYRYMLRTAPPDAIEQAHQEAFARLTPEQRKKVLEELTVEVRPEERSLMRNDPQSLARLATRAEVRQPGTLERLFGNARGWSGGGGWGMGGLFAGSLLSSLAGTVIGSAIAQSFFSDHHHDFISHDASSDEPGSGVLDPQPIEESSGDYGDLDDGGSFDDGGEFV